MLFGFKNNCWFCNQNTRVSYFDRNSWTCPHCEQYNGFKKDGDYNKEIPEMYRTARTNPFSSTNEKLNKSSDNKKTILCDRCAQNQTLKIQKLSNFEPKQKETFDLELDLYKEYMEKIYDLCDMCKSKVKFEITKQDGILKQYLYNIGKFDYLFERKFIQNKFKNIFKNETIIINSKKRTYSYRLSTLFLYKLIILFSFLIIIFNKYSSNSQVCELNKCYATRNTNNFERLIQKILLYTNITGQFYETINQKLPIFLISIYIFSCILLILDKSYKTVVTILTLDMILILINYDIIHSNLNSNLKRPVHLGYVPAYTIIIVLSALIKIFKIFTQKNQIESCTQSQKNHGKNIGSIIPDFNNNILRVDEKKCDHLIRPAKFKPISKSLFNFKTSNLDRLQTSIDSSDICSNLSRNSDDDSSSIVSGLTNLYLNRSNNLNNATYSYISPSIERKFFSFYQNGINIRNRSLISDKWTQCQSQITKNYKKEINLFY